MHHSSDQILNILDACAEAFSFPMLDNGYVYLATARLTLFRSATDWALVTEVFGFSPRAGLPDLNVSTFASTLYDRDTANKYVSAEAYQRYLHANPNNDTRFFFPIGEGDWQEPDDPELVARTAETIPLRGEHVSLPSALVLSDQGVEIEDANQMRVYELCRYLAAVRRQGVLATMSEQRISVLPEMSLMLQLDDWHHPNLVDGELPSQTETFRQLAIVLSTGDVRHYKPAESPNTHWRNWPDGGTL